MLQLTPHMRILLYVEPICFRRGIDGVAAVGDMFMSFIHTCELN
jgi:hypothetical protein